MDDQLETGKKTTKANEEFEAPRNDIKQDQISTETSVEANDQAESQPELEITPEIEAEVMEKVVALGLQRDIISHGTSGSRLELTAKYGLIANDPRFSERWDKYAEFLEKRNPNGGLDLRTSAALQGTQSVSFHDPWDNIELLEETLNKSDHFVYAIPVDYYPSEWPEEYKGRNIKPSTEEMLKIEAAVLEKMLGNIEEITDIAIPHSENSKIIVHGKFRVDPKTLRFLVGYDHLLKTKEDEGREAEKTQKMSELLGEYRKTDPSIDSQLSSSTENMLENWQKQAGKKINITELSPRNFLIQYRKALTDKWTSQNLKDFFEKAMQIYENYLPTDDGITTRLELFKRERRIMPHCSKFHCMNGSIIAQLKQSDILSGQVVRNNSGVLLGTSAETFIESRVPTRMMVGIQTGDLSRSDELKGMITQEKAEKFAQKLHIPVYDTEGNLTWPKQMSYEEVRQFVAKRDAEGESEEETMDSGSSPE